MCDGMEGKIVGSGEGKSGGGVCIPGPPRLLKGKENDAEIQRSRADGVWQLSSPGTACEYTTGCSGRDEKDPALTLCLFHWSML